MAERLREHLARVRELTAQLNAHSDEANTVVAAVEIFLTEVCNVGVDASVCVDGAGDEDGTHWDRLLRYGRSYDGTYRFFLVDRDFDNPDSRDGSPSEKWTPWANCARDIRLSAYDRLPDLLTKLIAQLEARIAKLQASTASIETILEFAAPPKKGGKR